MGIEQINQAIMQVDTAVQMNASLVEEAPAAATSMTDQATGLTHAVAIFQVVDGQAIEGAPSAGVQAPARQRQKIASKQTGNRVAISSGRAPHISAAEAAEWQEV